MAWTEDETLKYQMSNKEHLEEINKTLSGSTGKPKYGIFCQGQIGDTATVMSVLKYKDELFPDKDIVWFINSPNCDLLKYNREVSEVREWPWAGNGLPIGTPDFYPLLCDENNKLNKELAKEYELTKDLEDGIFPATWMVDIDKRRGVSYPNVSKQLFGIPEDWEWHPLLYFSVEEFEMALDFMKKIKPSYSHSKGNIFAIETFAGSGQAKVTAIQIIDAMDICRKVYGECYFVFVSHKFINGDENFPEGLINNVDVFSASHFTVRQCALIVGFCEMLISVSSGVTVAASCWNNNVVPILQFCGSKICGTQEISLGEFVMVTHDDKSLRSAWEEFKTKLIELLHKIK